MFYDVPYRHQQAVDPAALSTIAITLQAMTKALDDCRNAGVDPNTDPAMVLLARHMATVSTNRAPRSILRHACDKRLQSLKRYPALLALSIRGVEYDQAAKERFHEDATVAMRDLASALALVEGSYTIASTQGEVSESGYVLLAAADVAVMVRVGRRFEGREVSYRAVVPGVDQTNRNASMADLLRPARFAERLTRELRLRPAPASVSEPSLIAA